MTLEAVSVFSDPRFNNALTSCMAGFLASIGLQTAPAVLPKAGFLDGLMISRGVLLIDEARLVFPGDLLHEAGHLAVVPAERRTLLDGNAGGDPGEEMAAIAWSYAAALYLGDRPRRSLSLRWLFRRIAGHLEQFCPKALLRRANARVAGPCRGQRNCGPHAGGPLSAYAQVAERLRAGFNLPDYTKLLCICELWRGVAFLEGRGRCRAMMAISVWGYAG